MPLGHLKGVIRKKSRDQRNSTHSFFEWIISIKEYTEIVGVIISHLFQT